MKILGIMFLGLEFDFGCSEDDHSNLGRIDATVFVDTDNDGEKQRIEHKVQLHEISFKDFLSEDEIANIVNVGDDFGSILQTVRKLVMHKVANDLGMEIADVDYTPPKSLRNNVNELNESQSDQDDLLMDIILGRL